MKEGFAEITFLHVAIPHIDTWKNAITTCSMGSQDVFISASGSKFKNIMQSTSKSMIMVTLTYSVVIYSNSHLYSYQYIEDL